jgi:hypothetical protein
MEVMNAKWIISIILALVIILSNGIATSSSSPVVNAERVDIRKFDVITDFIQLHNPKVSYREAYKIAYVSWKESRKSKTISWTQLIAQQKVESHFDSLAVSYAGAKGIPQIMHPLWEWYDPYTQIISVESDLHLPEKSIPAQRVIMEMFLDKHKGNMWRAIRNYCGPYSQTTRNYVREVLKYKKLLDKQQAQI